MVSPLPLIFGGTAAYHLDPADFGPVRERCQVQTPYGPSPTFFRLETAQGAAWYASRHGEKALERSARFVNHRANLWAAHALGVAGILSWNGVGAINERLAVGQVLVPAFLLDWTRHRPSSFTPEAPHPVAASWRAAARTIDHIKAGHDPRQAAAPFDKGLRQAILAAVASLEPDLAAPLERPTYVCSEGPRLETAAEIRLAGSLGADVVGMTLCPEVWLAAELGLPYASLCLVTNFATGLWQLDARRQFGAEVGRRAMRLLLRAAALLPEGRRG